MPGYVYNPDVCGEIDHHDHPDWDRLNTSRTSRQIFAETATDYFEAHLLPVAQASWSVGDFENDFLCLKRFAKAQKAMVRRITTTWRVFIPSSYDHCYDPIAWQWTSDPIFRLHSLRPYSDLKMLVIVTVPSFVTDKRAPYVKRSRQEVQNLSLEVDFRDGACRAECCSTVHR
jgi:hypothetical protein